MTTIARSQLFENLRERRAELTRLQRRLAAAEEAYSRLRAGLREFTIRYFGQVGGRYVELERLEATLAAAVARLSPEDLDLRERAIRAAEAADDTAQALHDGNAALTDASCMTPAKSLRSLYRRVVRSLHPDLGGGDEGADYRHELMVAANRAYDEGDHQTLEALLAEFKAVDNASSDLERIEQQLGRVRRRIADTERNIDELRGNEMYGIWQNAEQAARYGRDLVAEKVASLDRSIARVRNRLQILSEE
jgi:hypothetical protein